jgi:hypothetical protein
VWRHEQSDMRDCSQGRILPRSAANRAPLYGEPYTPVNWQSGRVSLLGHVVPFVTLQMSDAMSYGSEYVDHFDGPDAFAWSSQTSVGPGRKKGREVLDALDTGTRNERELVGSAVGRPTSLSPPWVWSCQRPTRATGRCRCVSVADSGKPQGLPSGRDHIKRLLGRTLGKVWTRPRTYGQIGGLGLPNRYPVSGEASADPARSRVDPVKRAMKGHENHFARSMFLEGGTSSLSAISRTASAGSV